MKSIRNKFGAVRQLARRNLQRTGQVMYLYGQHGDPRLSKKWV